MARLVVNVFVNGKGYGPSFGNADDVPVEVVARIGDHCWDEPPERGVEHGSPSSQAGGTGGAPPAPSVPLDLDAVDDLDELRSIAAAAGVDVDKRWHAKRVREEIRKADA